MRPKMAQGNFAEEKQQHPNQIVYRKMERLVKWINFENLTHILVLIQNFKKH